MISIYFLRHGIAEEPKPGQLDCERRLTEEGIVKMCAEAAALSRMDLKLDTIVTSPYARALKTAEIVAEALGMSDRLEIEPGLGYGFRLGDLERIIRSRPQARRIMLVGHNPDFSIIPGQLVGGATIDLKKGGLIRVDIDAVELGAGILRWLIPPSVLIGSVIKGET